MKGYQSIKRRESSEDPKRLFVALPVFQKCPHSYNKTSTPEVSGTLISETFVALTRV